jgi:hypothetical protein
MLQGITLHITDLHVQYFVTDFFSIVKIMIGSALITSNNPNIRIVYVVIANKYLSDQCKH